MEVVRAARDESGITYVDFNTGHYEGDTYLDILEPFIRRIKKELGLLVGIQTPPHRDSQALRRPARDGPEPGVLLLRDLRPRALRGDLPGQALGVRPRPLPGRHRVLRPRSGERARATSPGWRTARSSPASSPPSRRSGPSTGSRRWAPSPPCASSGPSWAPTSRTPTRPRPRTWSPSSAASTRRAWRRGCPSACAPNVHVSLVLLPEECAALSPRRFPWQSLKLKAMAAVFSRQFEGRVATARGGSPAC